MNEESIERLMREAEAAAGGRPTVRGDLVESVWGMVRRRRRGKRVVGRVLVVVLLAAAGWGIWGRLGRDGGGVVARRDAGTAEVERMKRELAEIRREAEWRAELAERLWKVEEAERGAVRVRQMMEVDPMERVRERVEYAAFAMVYQADRMAREMGLEEPAAKVYRQVNESFPETQWAAVARERLARLKGS